MANTETQTSSHTPLDCNSKHLNNDKILKSKLSSSSSPFNEPAINNVKLTLRNSMTNASIRRYRSYFRRGEMNTRSVNLRYSSGPSFPLFHHFYLMRNSVTRRRAPKLSNRIDCSDTFTSSEKIYLPPHIEVSHVLTTIFITLASVCLLIIMIFLDLTYLHDAILKSTSQQRMLNSSITNNTSLCFHHPKVCVMKGLVIIIFIGFTVALCHTILRLYTRAKRHSRLLQRKTDELEKEKRLTEKLLHQILPPCVARELIKGRKAPAEYYESVTVYFSDIVGFTIIASMCSPNETCDMLNRLYCIFDAMLENFDVYKVETIGDAYMVVSGAPNRNGDKHPNEIANMSLALLRCKQQVRVPRTSAELQLRIGIHTGSVCAAVIGSKMPRYCMFGDTVNVASRMESSGLPERIHLSSDTYKKLTDRDQYVFEERGEIAIKGKGHMCTYFLLDRKPAQNV